MAKWNLERYVGHQVFLATVHDLRERMACGSWKTQEQVHLAKGHTLNAVGLRRSPSVVQLCLRCTDREKESSTLRSSLREGIMMVSMDHIAWIWHSIANSIARIELDSS